MRNSEGASAGDRRLVVLALAAAVCGLGVPATASAACSQLRSIAKVKSYGGAASTSYVSGTATGPPAGNAPNSATASIDHSASNLQIAGLKPGEVQGADFASLSTPTGGSVSVNDTFHDNSGSSHQSGSGPTKSGGDGNGVQITFDANNCAYQVMVSFGITTQTTANPAEPNDPGVGDNATSPAMPIPSNLVLKGRATIPASAGGATSGPHGLYDLSGDPSWSFAIEFVAPTTPEPGTANITWDLNPAGAPASARCVVPKVKGLTEIAAARALKRAHCKVGKISRSHSRSVAEGKVISSHPKAGTKKSAGSAVALLVSSGK
jgi:PASTA domain-containing protein